MCNLGVGIAYKNQIACSASCKDRNDCSRSKEAFEHSKKYYPCFETYNKPVLYEDMSDTCRHYKPY